MFISSDVNKGIKIWSTAGIESTNSYYINELSVYGYAITILREVM